jgi:hypothetical protein
MLLALIAFAFGMFIGWQRAASRGGDRLDRLQYGVAHGIAFALAALIAGVIAMRAGLL